MSGKESGYARYCEKQRLVKSDPLGRSFELEASSDNGEPKFLSEEDSLIDVEGLDEPVFVNLGDEKVIEEMLTSITEDGEPVAFESFDEKQSKKFSYDSDEEDLPEDEPEAQDVLDEAQDNVEDLDEALSEIEDLLD